MGIWPTLAVVPAGASFREHGLGWVAVVGSLVIATACDEPPREREIDRVAPTSPPPIPASDTRDRDDPPAELPEPVVELPAEGSPSTWMLERPTMVYDAPRFDAAFRGKIERREPFVVLARTAGDPRCEATWARVAPHAYACLEAAREVPNLSPRILPIVPPNMRTPYVYARRRKPRAGQELDPDPPVFSSRAALGRGDPPVATLEAEHDYRFVEVRRSGRHDKLLVDERKRVVRERDVQVFEPSPFRGRDLLAEPIPPGLTLAYGVQWPSATIYASPDPVAVPIGQLEFHQQVYVFDLPRAAGGRRFVPTIDGRGWLDLKEIRRVLPIEPPTDAPEDRIWIDVDLDEQVLTLWQGASPRFVTLISSGTMDNATPTGLFRIQSKHALDEMNAQAGDEDQYVVEGVPWVLYFKGRYALHGTYWHNRFGRRTSHGCVNLSPLDAARVFAATTPAMLPGWISVYEHPEDLGTLVRIRRGAIPVVDRRTAPLRRYADGPKAPSP